MILGLLITGIVISGLVTFFSFIGLFIALDDADGWIAIWALLILAISVIGIVFFSMATYNRVELTPYKFAQACQKQGGQVTTNNNKYEVYGSGIKKHAVYNCVINGQTVVSKQIG